MHPCQNIEGQLNYAVDLVQLIKEEFGDYFVIGVAGKIISAFHFFNECT